MHDRPEELPPQNPHESTDRPGDQDPKQDAADTTRGATASPIAPTPGTSAVPAAAAPTALPPATSPETTEPEAPPTSSSHRGRWVAGAAAVAGATAAVPIVYRAVTGHWPFQGVHADPVHVRTTLTIYRPSREVYDFWRSLDQLPRFLRHLEQVEILGDHRSRWTARSAAGKTVSWEAEITEDRPAELLAWRSVEDSEVETGGRVSFRDDSDGRGTRMEVDLHLAAPGGRAGKAVADLLQPATERQVREDLRRFKNLMEAGEVPETHGQHGDRSTLSPSRSA